jgi:hypothetical protein
MPLRKVTDELLKVDVVQVAPFPEETVKLDVDEYLYHL